jgi:5'-3' exoribonuclease 1
MGVPKFFRWLTEKYPQINVRISEGRRRSDYVDNFYLDMNGIIHQCTHGEEIGPQEKLSEDQMVERIFAYTERLIAIANPRKVLYLAIDGVAPRAKMNQQRSRRYRVPREMAQQALRDKANEKAMQFKKEGLTVAQGQTPPMRDTFSGPPPPPPFDSNCITPGTDFLYRLGKRYESWIQKKMQTDPKWQQGPTVVFSGADVPGEGEHKIMDFIRETRAQSPSRDATRHCMYGLDADLIMLGMITHETHFSLLRERQKFQRGRFAPRGRGRGANRGRGGGNGNGNGRGSRAQSPVLQLSPVTGRAAADAAESEDQDFVFLELELLRQCLAGSMRPPVPAGSLGFAWEQERAVDDFVFLCMLVGNDFLPGLPSLDVADGALNLMMKVYTDTLPKLGGYITHKGELHMGR